MRTLLVALAVLTAAAVLASADSTVVLKDGSTVVGRLIESGDMVGVVTEDGLRLLNRSEIERIEYDAFGRASKEQVEAYLKVQRATEQAKHPTEAIAAWQKYIENCPKTNPLLAEARKELERWAEALKTGKVIWSGKLVTAEERDGLKAKGLGLLQRAVAELRTGRTQQAASLLREAMRSWPDHPGIRFHYALALQKSRDPNEAARYYRLVLDERPDHVPTLNNLAVLECIRRQYAIAVPLFLRAVNLAPDVVSVNDNAYRTLLRLEEAKFRGLENEMAQLRTANLRFESAMRNQGLARWGTAWLTVDKVNELEARNLETENQIKQLVADVNAIANEIQILKGRIAELERQRLSAPNEREVLDGVDVDGDGRPDFFLPRDTLTKEKIDLMLADHYGRLAGKEGEQVNKVAEARKLQASRVEPARDLDYVLLEEPGDELMAPPMAREAAVTLVPSFVGPTSVAELVTAIRSGKAIILADDGSFLGKISSDRTDPQAILNPEGQFGNATGEFSLMNPDSKYAQKDSEQSVANPQATRPPRLFYEGNLLAYVTENNMLTPRIRFPAVISVLRGE